jgi:hypothetical protein
MKHLLKLHYENQKLQGIIKQKTNTKYFVQKSDELFWLWVDNIDPEPAVELITTVSDWLIHNGYDFEAILEEINRGKST